MADGLSTVVQYYSSRYRARYDYCIIRREPGRQWTAGRPPPDPATRPRRGHVSAPGKIRLASALDPTEPSTRAGPPCSPTSALSVSGPVAVARRPERRAARTARAAVLYSGVGIACAPGSGAGAAAATGGRPGGGSDARRARGLSGEGGDVAEAATLLRHVF
ncbi:hypothetical protein GQ55_1G276000 [Panicum hallii var. hallii]|uniref:Uncharacterized protein n=1 Tax=Panicum hallii var. hallii TaxID=1504633 RepID=A0A2T7F857_9POAL|nr:hypothetical protein GQ55_1G276000 [Panicum hallii var. hallii]